MLVNSLLVGADLDKQFVARYGRSGFMDTRRAIGPGRSVRGVATGMAADNYLYSSRCHTPPINLGMGRRYFVDSRLIGVECIGVRYRRGRTGVTVNHAYTGHLGSIGARDDLYLIGRSHVGPKIVYVLSGYGVRHPEILARRDTRGR